MATHVLVPMDDSPQSWSALDHALSQYRGERITVLHAVDPLVGLYGDAEANYYTPEAHERAVERGEKLCKEAHDRADESGALETTVFDSVVETGQPTETILSYANDHDVDHIVLGSHGRSGFSRILLGSVAETVTRRAPVPVTIVR